MEESSRTGRSALIIRLAMIAVFATTLTLCSIHADFPFVYNPDEPAKVEQVITGERNFNHPPLMLGLTRAVVENCRIALVPQRVAEVGRFLSAVSLALAAAALTWLAGEYGGSSGAVCAAVALGTDAQAVLAGHFFKEDALFALGIALTFCAGAIHWRRRAAGTLLSLGAAAGLAISAKYVGILAVGYALVLAGLAAGSAGENELRGRTRAAAVARCLLAALTVFFLLNGVALAEHFTQWRHGMTFGFSVWQHGNQSVGASVPNLTFAGMLFLLTPLPMLMGAVTFWWSLREYPLHAHAERWLAGLSPLWLLVVFSFSASTAVRYFLPVSLMLDCISGAAWPSLASRVFRRWKLRQGEFQPTSYSTKAGIVLILLFALPRVFTLINGFGCDDREALRGWIAQHLPPSAVIAEDSLARLEVAPSYNGVKLPQQVIGSQSVADLGDASDLQKRGVSWVVICLYDSRRYLDRNKHPAADATADFERRSAFYRTLPKQATRLWQSELCQPFALRPGLELYQLSKK